jgi:DNA-binding FadR family transcriptional regulator
MAEKGPSRADEVADALEMEILRAGSPAGTRIGLRTDLINRFQVSPGVMNEALRLLRERGTIAVKPGPSGGVFTADPPPGVRMGAMDLWFQGLALPPLELFKSRVVLEDMFNSLAAGRATTGDLQAMETALRGMEAAKLDCRRYFLANVEFHRTIAQSTGYTVLVSFYEAMCAVLTGAIVRAEWVDGWEKVIDHNVAVHAQLLEAIRTNDRSGLDVAIKLHHIDMVNHNDPVHSPTAPPAMHSANGAQQVG